MARPFVHRGVTASREYKWRILTMGIWARVKDERGYLWTRARDHRAQNKQRLQGI